MPVEKILTSPLMNIDFFCATGRICGSGLDPTFEAYPYTIHTFFIQNSKIQDPKFRSFFYIRENHFFREKSKIRKSKIPRLFYSKIPKIRKQKFSGKIKNQKIKNSKTKFPRFSRQNFQEISSEFSRKFQDKIPKKSKENILTKRKKE